MYLRLLNRSVDSLAASSMGAAGGQARFAIPVLLVLLYNRQALLFASRFMVTFSNIAGISLLLRVRPACRGPHFAACGVTSHPACTCMAPVCAISGLCTGGCQRAGCALTGCYVMGIGPMSPGLPLVLHACDKCMLHADGMQWTTAARPCIWSCYQCCSASSRTRQVWSGGARLSSSQTLQAATTAARQRTLRHSLQVGPCSTDHASAIEPASLK